MKRITQRWIKTSLIGISCFFAWTMSAEATTLDSYTPKYPEENGICGVDANQEQTYCGKNQFYFGLHRNYPADTSLSARQGGYSVIKENDTFYLTWSGEHYLKSSPDTKPSQSYLNLYLYNTGLETANKLKITDQQIGKTFQGKVELSQLKTGQTYIAQHCVVVNGIKDCRWLESTTKQTTDAIAGNPYSVIMATNPGTKFSIAPNVMRLVISKESFALDAKLTWSSKESNGIKLWTDGQARTFVLGSTGYEDLEVADRYNPSNYTNTKMQVLNYATDAVYKTYSSVSTSEAVPNCYNTVDTAGVNYSCQRGIHYLLTDNELTNLPVGEYYFKSQYTFTNKPKWGSHTSALANFNQYGRLALGDNTLLIPNAFNIGQKSYTFRFSYANPGVLILEVENLSQPDLSVVLNESWTNQNVAVTFKAEPKNAHIGVKQIYYQLTGATSTGGWKTIANGGSITISNTGVTTISAYVVDTENNQTSTKTYNARIDRTTPTLTLTPNPALTNQTSNVIVQASDAGGSGIATLIYRIHKDGGTSQSLEVPAGNQIPITESGNHVVEVSVTDHAGNNTTKKTTVMVDKVMPSASGALNPETGIHRKTTVTLSQTDNYKVGYLEYYTSTSSTANSNHSSWTRYSKPFDVTTHGQSYVHYRAVDAAGNKSPVYSLAITNDSQGPTITLNPSSYFSNQDITVHVSAVDTFQNSINTLHQISYLLKGAQTTDGWQSLSLQGETVRIHQNGTTQLQVRAEDVAGNVSTKEITVVVDSLAPNPTLTHQTEWTNQNVSVTAQVKDDGEAGMLESRYQLTGATTQGWTSLTASNHQGTFTVQNEGLTTISLYGKDKANNEKTIQSVVRIDKTKPTGSITLSHEGCTNAAEVTINLQAGDALSQVKSSKYRLYGATTKGWTTYTPGSSFTVQNEGITTVEIEVIDQAGNVFTTSKEIKINRKGPALNVVVDEAWTNKGQVSATLNLSHNSAFCPISQQQYRLTGATTKDWATFKTGDVITITNAGQTTIEVRATDQSTNSATTQKTVKIDRTNPTISITANEAWSGKASDTATITLGDTGGSGVSYARYRLSGATNQGWTVIAGNSTVTVSNEGETTIEASVYDVAGNVTHATSKTIRLDQSAPQISITHNGTGGWQNTPITITTTITDSHSGIQSVTNPDDQVSAPSNSAKTVLTHVANLNDYYFFKATDKVGNIAEKYVLIEKLDFYKPILKITGTTTWTNQNVTVVISGLDPVIDPNQGLYP